MPDTKVRDGEGGSKWTPGEWVCFYKHKYNEWHVSVPVEGSSFKLGLFENGVPTGEADARLIAAATAWMIERQSDEYGPRENWPARERIEAQEAALALAEGGEG